MASKVQTYTELAVRRTAAVTGSYEEWSAFLAVAARVYKKMYSVKGECEISPNTT